MLTKIKVYACYTKTPPPQKKIQTGGRAPGAPVLDPPLTYGEHNEQQLCVGDWKSGQSICFYSLTPQ